MGVPTTCTSQVAVSTVRVPLFAHHAVLVRVAHVLISRVAKPSASSRDAFRRPSHVTHSPGSLHPCNALRRCPPRRHRLTPADRTVCVPDPQTDTRGSYL